MTIPARPRRRRKLIAYALGGVLIPAAGIAYSLMPASAAPPGAITGYGGKCVDVAGASTANGTAVQLYDCNGTGAQSWTVGTDGTLQALGKCLDVTAARHRQRHQGPAVRLQRHRRPEVDRSADGTTWSTRSSGKCLDATGPSSANGTRLQIWDCAGTANQKLDAARRHHHPADDRPADDAAHHARGPHRPGARRRSRCSWSPARRTPRWTGRPSTPTSRTSATAAATPPASSASAPAPATCSSWSQHYTDRKPGNVLAKYLPALRKVNGTDSHAGLDPNFTKRLAKTAAEDPAFQQAQDDERDRVYFNPAVAAGQGRRPARPRPVRLLRRDRHARPRRRRDQLRRHPQARADARPSRRPRAATRRRTSTPSSTPGSAAMKKEEAHERHQPGRHRAARLPQATATSTSTRR